MKTCSSFGFSTGRGARAIVTLLSLPPIPGERVEKRISRRGEPAHTRRDDLFIIYRLPILARAIRDAQPKCGADQPIAVSPAAAATPKKRGATLARRPLAWWSGGEEVAPSEAGGAEFDRGATAAAGPEPSGRADQAGHGMSPLVLLPSSLPCLDRTRV